MSTGKDPLAPLTYAPEGRAVRVGSPVWSCEQTAMERGRQNGKMTELVGLRCRDGQSTIMTLAMCTVGANDGDRALLFVDTPGQSFTLSLICTSVAMPPTTTF